MSQSAQNLTVHSDLVAMGIVRTVESLADDATRSGSDRIPMTVDEAFALYLWAYDAMLANHHPAAKNTTLPRVAHAQQFLASIRSTDLPSGSED